MMASAQDKEAYRADRIRTAYVVDSSLLFKLAVPVSKGTQEIAKRLGSFNSLLDVAKRHERSSKECSYARLICSHPVLLAKGEI